MSEKKILLVVPPEGFDDEQYQTCRRFWESRGHKVSVASLSGIARGEAGTAVPVDTLIRDVKTYNYDAVVFLGGEGARILYDDESARNLAKDVKYKVIGASGNAVLLLSLAGTLENKKVTGPPDLAGWLLKSKARYTGEPVCVDDRLVTIQAPAMAEQLAASVAAALDK
ncbi:MAG: DJ-1/PfpI family protein [Dehalococcoidia bacterium]|nr:DJ-1/PfpI family protein [Dehalococcoidia bacterium]